MRITRVALAFGIVLISLPAVASAALSIQVGPRQGPGPDFTVFPPLPGQEQFFDLIFHETGTPDNEGLFAYDLELDAAGPLRLVRVEKPDNWVFTAPDASLAVADGATPQRMIVNAINTLTGALSDITEGSKAARVYFTVDPSAGYGAYAISLNPAVTIFGSGDPNHELLIPVDISDRGEYHYVPEPSGLALLGMAGVLILRRNNARRGAEVACDGCFSDSHVWSRWRRRRRRRR